MHIHVLLDKYDNIFFKFSWRSLFTSWKDVWNNKKYLPGLALARVGVVTNDKERLAATPAAASTESLIINKIIQTRPMISIVQFKLCNDVGVYDHVLVIRKCCPLKRCETAMCAELGWIGRCWIALQKRGQVPVTWIVVWSCIKIFVYGLNELTWGLWRSSFSFSVGTVFLYFLKRLRVSNVLAVVERVLLVELRWSAVIKETCPNEHKNVFA